MNARSDYPDVFAQRSRSGQTAVPKTPFNPERASLEIGSVVFAPNYGCTCRKGGWDPECPRHGRVQWL